ncbi:hypothetical protein CLAVI_000453 [Candidatus Clavichlamydia salmonicola]|uniref:dipeptidase n=1 Tax=Candidatus Clavichlamydia salmonicola TaxID=469812 RepID=UPI0018914E5A|nr:membrane dipeptidase [Candidatus Clavichlamydia salmonicola]MBF5050834.1 hypothetical protein [Candidatus Clavichlamydia salmonicola]
MIIDMHCDLLDYLVTSPGRSPYDTESRCSLPFLREGGISLQICACFTDTKPGSGYIASEQVVHYRKIQDPYVKTIYKDSSIILTKDKTALMLAFENASGLCEENDNLKVLETRLRAYADEFIIAYVGLMWNSDSRFGGGPFSKKGLTADGKVLIDLLVDLKIPIDFSHSSDQVFYDVVDYVEARHPQAQLLASHSNLRSIVTHPRNLTPEQVKILVKKGGLIGLNFLKSFLGKEFKSSLKRQIIELLELGAEDALCFGSDFFSCWFYGNRSLPEEIDVYHKGYGSSRCLSDVAEEIAVYLSPDLTQKIIANNVIQFLTQRVPIKLQMTN